MLWRNLLVVPILIVGCLLLFTGCGYQRHTGGLKTQRVNRNDYHVIVLQFEGRPITCIQSHIAGASNGAYGGITCDWVAYHHIHGGPN